MSNITQLLVTSRALIADRDRWCQGHNAEDAAGNMVSVSDDRGPGPVIKPVRWCSMGALMRILGDGDELGLDEGFGLEHLGDHDTAQAITYDLLDQAARQLGFNDVVELNDWVPPATLPVGMGHGRAAAHGNVMQMYDLAITTAKEKYQ